MVRFFPKIDPSEIKNAGERAVAEALVSQLRGNIEVIHNFSYLGTTKSGALAEGECDFIILDPENGVLLVEVKGGTLAFNPDEQKWVRETPPDGRQEILSTDPFAQVQRNMREVISLIREHFPGRGSKLLFTFGFAVAFPSCTYSGKLPPSIAPDLVFDAKKCENLAKSVQNAFNRFRRDDYPPLTPRQMESIREALLPRFKILPVTWRQVKDQEERLHRMTVEQQHLIEFLGDRSLAAIKGVAGSGKTLLALFKAQKMARAGFRTLFLCYNAPLKEWLKSAAPDSFGNNLTIDNYHGLVFNLCKVAGIPIEGVGLKDEEFWNNTTPEMLMQACELLGPEHKFDAIVVDEGQDFHDLWWTSMDSLFRNPSKGVLLRFL